MDMMDVMDIMDRAVEKGKQNGRLMHITLPFCFYGAALIRTSKAVRQEELPLPLWLHGNG